MLKALSIKEDMAVKFNDSGKKTQKNVFFTDIVLRFWYFLRQCSAPPAGFSVVVIAAQTDASIEERFWFPTMTRRKPSMIRMPSSCNMNRKRQFSSRVSSSPYREEETNK